MPFYRINEPGQPRVTAHLNFGRKSGPLACVFPNPDTPEERCARMSVALCDGPDGRDARREAADLRRADVRAPPHGDWTESGSLSALRREGQVMNWFELQRQGWIAETLEVFHFINREHLRRKFGISTPQASKDLNAFQRDNPRAMTYDLSAKHYVATAEFRFARAEEKRDAGLNQSHRAKNVKIATGSGPR